MSSRIVEFYTGNGTKFAQLEPTGLPPDTGRNDTRSNAMLTVGDIVPSVDLLAADGSSIALESDRIAGHYTILVLCGDPASDGAISQLDRFGAANSEIVAAGGMPFCVTTQHSDAIQPQVPLARDPAGILSAAIGATGTDVITLVIRPNHHVMAILSDEQPDHAAAALAVIRDDSENRAPREVTRHPPVLIVPDVLSRADCDHLISIFNFKGNVWVEPGDGPKNMADDYKMRIPDYGREDRIDHWIINPETQNFVSSRLRARLFPEIEKAFHYKITQHERYRIGNYKGARGGEAHGHRDNTADHVAHRRFAASINLNSEQFKGGELRFPEYGGHLYRPETGAAIVFSSSMLHEPLHVTEGQRFVLLSFLFGDH
jgi:hypothetical protein